MAKKNKLTAEQLEELCAFAAEASSPAVVKKVACVIMQQRLSSGEVAEALLWKSAAYCRQIKSKYMRFGLDSLCDGRATGGPRRISYEDEETVLAAFNGRCPFGALCSALNAKAGGILHDSTVRRILRRHGWANAGRGFYEN